MKSKQWAHQLRNVGGTLPFEYWESALAKHAEPWDALMRAFIDAGGVKRNKQWRVGYYPWNRKTHLGALLVTLVETECDRYHRGYDYVKGVQWPKVSLALAEMCCVFGYLFRHGKHDFDIYESILNTLYPVQKGGAQRDILYWYSLCMDKHMGLLMPPLIVERMNQAASLHLPLSFVLAHSCHNEVMDDMSDFEFTL